VETCPADAANVPLARPAATTTLAGVVTLPLLDDSGTLKPPAGAFPERVTVHVLLAGVVRLVGAQFRPATATETGN